MVVIGYFSEQNKSHHMCFWTVHRAERRNKNHESINLFSVFANGEPLESRYTMIHICWKMTHDNHICPFITKTFENFYALHELGKIR